ncbi:MAG: hypothetical protein ABI611_02185 [Solirubrobacteraceae bacterium]
MTVVAGYELADLLALRDLSRDELEARFDGVETDPNVRYERIEPVDRLHSDAFPGHFYFRGDELALLYIPRSALRDAGLGELARELGEPAATLSSRTGEDSTLYVYPGRGVAFASDGEQVEILELFPPTTREAYEAGIYDPPPERIR